MAPFRLSARAIHISKMAGIKVNNGYREKINNKKSDTTILLELIINVGEEINKCKIGI